MIGGGAIAAKYLLALQHNPYYGFQVDGYLAGQENPALACRYLGGYDRMDESMDDPLIEEVIIAVECRGHGPHPGGALRLRQARHPGDDGSLL